MLKRHVDFNINKQEVYLSNTPELSLVCVLHNQFALLQSELTKLLLTVSGYNLEIVLWDNGSTDFSKNFFMRKGNSTKVRYFYSPLIQTTEESYLEAEKRTRSEKIMRVDLENLPDQSNIGLNYISKLVSKNHKTTLVQRILDKVEAPEQSSTASCVSKAISKAGMPIGIRDDISLLKRDLEERGWHTVSEPERGIVYFNTDTCGVVTKTAKDKSWFYISGSGRKRIQVDQTTSFLRCPG